jgi:hypothetical protein
MPIVPTTRQDPLNELKQEARLIAHKSGIALDPNAPIVGFVRAAAATGNARAQRLLASMKAAFNPPV